MELKDSQSWKNMETALNAEALAYVTYTFFGRRAKTAMYRSPISSMRLLVTSCIMQNYCSSAYMMAKSRMYSRV